MQHIIDLPEVYRTALNDYLYYTARQCRLNEDILNGSYASPEEIGYSDLYEAFKDDTEFAYLEECSIVYGAKCVLQRTFGNILMHYYNATDWHAEFADENTPCAIYATINGDKCKVFDFRNSVDRAMLDEATIDELERLFNGPDLTDNEE